MDVQSRLMIVYCLILLLDNSEIISKFCAAKIIC